MEPISRTIAAIGLALVLALPVAWPAWAGQAEGGDSASVVRPAVKPEPKLQVQVLGQKPLLKRAVVRTLGQPRTLPHPAAPVADEFETLPLGRLGPAPSAGLLAHQLPSVPAQLSHDCALAESGDAAAAYRVGRRFLFGMWVPQDKRMGVAWMRAAASRGYPPALQVAALVPANMGRMRPWCRSTSAPLHQLKAPPAEIVQLVRSLAPAYGLDPQLVLAVIEIESAFHSDAVSPKEAAGLMQLIPDTAQRFGVHDVFDPADNLRGGMKYLRWLLAYFEGNVSFALAGYNAGERAVDRYSGIPPYAETQAYVRLIHRLYPPLTHGFDPSVTEPSPLVAHRQTADAGH